MNWGVFALFASLAIFFIIRMPISFSMLASCIVYFLIARPASMGMVYSVITGDMITGFTMLAAPLFVFMANVLNEGEVTDKMFSFCNGLLGRLKGGTAQVNVFISLIFSGMSGSAIADASGIGLMEIEQMKKEGYDAEFSCAITAASVLPRPSARFSRHRSLWLSTRCFPEHRSANCLPAVWCRVFCWLSC